MAFSADAWEATTTVRRAIDELPFLRELEAGTLAEQTFTCYLEQDALYLASYARVLAACASQTSDMGELLFWTDSARTAVLIEREMHANHVADLAAATMSATCTAYTSYLWSLVGGSCYPALAAGLLPCFWVYQDVGQRLAGRVGEPAGHPYAEWLATYADPAFALAAEQARGIADRLAHEADPGTLTRMHDAFATATRYEWLFWDAAYRRES